ncbi:MAG: hypothetical protein ABW110_03310 [Steroidobacteraceae bacterium]
MQAPYHQLIQELRSRYPGTRNPNAHKAWQEAVYQEASKVQDVGREVFVYMCLSAQGTSCGNA